MSKKELILGALLVVGTMAGSMQGTALAAPARQAAATDWTVLAGGDSPDMAFSAMQFYPANLTINVGDTITWQHNSADVHNVFFPALGQDPPPLTLPPDAQGMIQENPISDFPQGGATYDGSAMAGSGVMGIGAQPVKTYKLTFTKAGTYTYFCIFHMPAMKGTITVQAAGSNLPMTPDAALSAGRAQLAKDLADAQDAVAKMPAPQKQPGTNTYNINISAPLPTVDYMRFSTDNLTINQGDSVAWTETSLGTPHTVTLASGGAEPDLNTIVPQQNGPPNIYFNPVALIKQGGDTYNGEGLYNSGFLWGTQVPIPGSRSYSLTFSKPGTYEYYCILHDTMAMKGYITVLAASGGNVPGMPTTGRGDSLWLAFAAVGAAMLLGGARLRRVKATS